MDYRLTMAAQSVEDSDNAVVDPDITWLTSIALLPGALKIAVSIGQERTAWGS
jgi:hypothetical protein